MKRMKKLASLILAMVMALAMTATAFAADDHEHVITINENVNDKGTHYYEAYQIFAGDLADNPEYKKLNCNEEHEHGDECYKVDSTQPQYILSNIIWGSGVDGNAVLTALHTSGKDDSKAVTEFKEKYADKLIACKSAADVADFISTFASSTSQTSEDIDVFASIISQHLTTECYTNGNGEDEDSSKVYVNGSGYYFIKDMDASLVGQENAAYTRFLLQVVGDASVNVKSEVPGGDKQVYIDADTTGDANNASIGSHVSYEITSKVPNHAGYDYYYFIMNDTLSDGLTLDYKQGDDVPEAEKVDSFTVKIGDKTLVRGKDYYVYTGADADPKTFRLAFENIMGYTVGADIVVTYSATVNEKAIIGTTGNPNTWTLQYSNNPDESERKDDENKPGLPKDEENTPLGETPEEKTLTYVTELDITKYANSVAEDHLLAGAEFTLTGTSHQVVLSTVDYYAEPEEGEEGKYYLLLDGTYTTSEPSTDVEYREIGIGTEETTEGYIKVGDGYIVPEDKDDYIGETIYTRVIGNADKYADVNTKYVKKHKDETSYVEADISIRMTTGEDGKISFKDLGAGTYTLTETVTPAGFNTLDPITFTITFTPPAAVKDGTEKCTWAIDWTGAKDTGLGENNEGTPSGIFAADVINNSGSLLPSTGGIGTTIFTIVGAALIIGAGVLLVVKKRMNKN